MNKPLLSFTLSLFALAGTANAADYTVNIQNLTRSTYFTPLLVAAHPGENHLFTAGESASTSLQTMAEGGDIAPLVADVEALGGLVVANPAEGLLVPGATTSASINNDESAANTHLSVVAMLLPTNDGFVGLDALPLPTEAGVYHYYLNGYDAGTEANDEIRGSGAVGMAGMPVPPPLEDQVGTMGSGVATQAEGYVHIHRGVMGDTEAEGGTSDIDATRHRWLNPVAKVTVTVE